jgi:hypothetical protein
MLMKWVQCSVASIDRSSSLNNSLLLLLLFFFFLTVFERNIQY